MKKKPLKLLEESDIKSIFKIKSFIILIYSVAGLLISTITAFLTFIIIGAPIGSKMVIQIILTILFISPIIITISYVLGNYLSKKFSNIENRLEEIKNENFTTQEEDSLIIEIKDINENLNFLSKRLYNLIGDLKQQNQNLSNLLISLAHDVKTPLTILNGHIEEIEDGLIKKNDLDLTLKSMKYEVNFLNELTIDMLDFISSMNNNKTKSKIKFKDFINKEICPLFYPKQNVLFINDIAEDFICNFNQLDLKKICLNILENASKFTIDGHIRITKHENTIIFENTGEEIKEEYKDKIFEPFFTVSKSKNRLQTGFGLGLSIVSNLASNNGYKCYLKSSDKNKTIFYLEKV